MSSDCLDEEVAEQGAEAEYSTYCEDHPDHGPAVRSVLERIGDKWSLLVIVTLERKALRYGALKRRIPGISQRMLTLTLRQLERDGLVTRRVSDHVPPQVEYELTSLGSTLISPARMIAHWAIANYPAIQDARRHYDR